MFLKRKFLYFIVGVSTLLFACSILGGGYEMTFSSTDDWVLEGGAGFTGYVEDGSFKFIVDDSESIFWTYAGETFNEEDTVAAGTYEVQVTQTAGPEDPAYGLILGVNSIGTAFYLFEVSTDGFYSISSCSSSCDEFESLTGDNLWIESTDVQQGLNVTHNLKVVITESGDVTFSDNGVQLYTFNDPNMTGDDIGMVVETFDGANVTVSFDNLKYTPPEN